ncbi:hypothetical protein G6F33_002386 [Rhizopus arrhizus]|nr:hypothetical protein G6F34_000019 [Rhizopus arrhizus]KAG0916460.1 hypothetical protein G6F33_002386 [Rhizopus arrhizus]KAG1432012.1 hypothetical protein G6F59_000600 [Rhizopus arrhizus]
MSATQQGTKLYPGITKPLSLEGPTEYDIHLTKELQKTLMLYGLYDSEETAKLREHVLKSLDEMTKKFVQFVYERQGFSKEQALKAGGKIFTYGSYRLGVNAKATNEQIKDITPVTDAFVPVIKFKYSGIPIDFVCARLNLEEISEDIDLKDPEILRGLDAHSVRSINGTRVADDILNLVPNMDTFRATLRCIKLWATRKAVYSNVLGFLGGVAWAILVARVCQLYPHASASTLISKFFHILTSWSWPSPVMLKAVEDGPAFANTKPWNPKLNPTDRSHRMPVITPSYPSMCTTHNVTQSTQRIITGEIKRAAKIVDKIVAGSAKWPQLFEAHNFFKMYRQYLQITVIADNYELQLKWTGLVEARLRQLVIKLEAIHSVMQVHPFMDGFSETCLYRTSTNKATVSQGEKYDNNRTIGKMKMEVDVTIPIEEFKRMCRSWTEYDYRHMGVEIDRLEQSDLPKDVTALGKRKIVESNVISTTNKIAKRDEGTELLTATTAVVL